MELAWVLSVPICVYLWFKCLVFGDRPLRPENSKGAGLPDALADLNCKL